MAIHRSIAALVSDVQQKLSIYINNNCIYRVIRHPFPHADVWYDLQLWIFLIPLESLWICDCGIYSC